MQRGRWRALTRLALCAGGLMAGCGPTPTVGGPAPGGGTPAPGTFASLVSDVFVPYCSSTACHGGASPNYYPQLDADTTYDQIVGAPATQASLNLVEPNDPAASYLVLKLRDQQAGAGGSGTVMPPPYAAEGQLDEATIEAIEAWISNGAPND